MWGGKIRDSAKGAKASKRTTNSATARWTFLKSTAAIARQEKKRVPNSSDKIFKRQDFI